MKKHLENVRKISVSATKNFNNLDYGNKQIFANVSKVSATREMVDY